MAQYESYSEAYEKVLAFIKKRGYSYSVKSILQTYRDYYQKGFYVSHSAKDCIENLKEEFAVLDKLHQ